MNASKVPGIEKSIWEPVRGGIRFLNCLFGTVLFDGGHFFDNIRQSSAGSIRFLSADGIEYRAVKYWSVRSELSEEGFVRAERLWCGGRRFQRLAMAGSMLLMVEYFQNQGNHG